MIKLYICCLVLIIGSVEVGPDIDMKFHLEVMEIVSYDTSNDYGVGIKESNRLHGNNADILIQSQLYNVI